MEDNAPNGVTPMPPERKTAGTHDDFQRCDHAADRQIAQRGGEGDFLGGGRGRPELAASAERAVYVMWGLLAVASFALLRALLTHDFSIEYVAAFLGALRAGVVVAPLPTGATATTA